MFYSFIVFILKTKSKMDIAELNEKLDKILEEINDIHEALDEKDFQILHIERAIDAIKEKINS